MTEQSPDTEPTDLLRSALRSIRDDTGANRLARNSILASVEDAPELYAVALEELAWPQAELDVHLSGQNVEEHSTRADPPRDASVEFTGAPACPRPRRGGFA